MFVRGAINGVVREALIAGCLTGVMILLFIGSWRSTVIIAISIPLSILTSIIVFSVLHQTINIMTLGGLALAVGILVDDATVEIENINRILEEGHETDIRQAILDGAQQIAVPALVSTLCICIVFMPSSSWRRGALSVCSAGRGRRFCHACVLSSFPHARSDAWRCTCSRSMKMKDNRAQRILALSEGIRAALRAPARLLSLSLTAVRAHRRKLFSRYFLQCVCHVSSCSLVGTGFLPPVGQRAVHSALRAKTGTRIEETARLSDRS